MERIDPMECRALTPRCRALIDQDRYIGADPVGHICFESAKYSVPIDSREFPICEKCWNVISGKRWDLDHAATQIQLGGFIWKAPLPLSSSLQRPAAQANR